MPEIPLLFGTWRTPFGDQPAAHFLHRNDGGEIELTEPLVESVQPVGVTIMLGGVGVTGGVPIGGKAMGLRGVASSGGGSDQDGESVVISDFSNGPFLERF